MYMIVAMMFAGMMLLVISNSQVAGLESSAAYDQRIVAEQMAIYHAAAGRVCAAAGACPTGVVSPVSVNDQLSDMRRNRGVFSNGRLTAIAVTVAPGETYLVTYLADASPLSLRSRGTMLATLRDMSPPDAGFWSGTVDRASSRIRVRGQRFWHIADTEPGPYDEVYPGLAATQIDQTIPIPATLLDAIPDGTPALVNRI